MAILRDNASNVHPYAHDYELDQIESANSLGAINPLSSMSGSLLFSQLVRDYRGEW